MALNSYGQRYPGCGTGGVAWECNGGAEGPLMPPRPQAGEQEDVLGVWKNNSMGSIVTIITITTTIMTTTTTTTMMMITATTTTTTTIMTTIVITIK